MDPSLDRYRLLKDVSKRDIMQSLGKNQSLRSILRFLQFLRPYWMRGVEAGILMLLAVLLQLPMPFVSMYIIDDVIVEGNRSLLNILIIALFSVLILRIIIGFLQSYLLEIFKRRVLFDIQLRIFEHVQRLPLEYFRSHSTGYIMSRIRSDAEASQGIMAETVLSFLKDTATLLVGITCVFVLHWKLALLSVSILPFFIISISINSRRLRVLTKDAQEKGALFTKELQEAISGAELIKSFNLEKTIARRFVGSFKKVINSVVRLKMTGLTLGSLTNLIGGLGPLILLWYGGAEIINGNLTLGQFVAFNAFLGYLFGPTQRLMSLNLNVQQSLGSIERIFELLDLPLEKSGNGRKSIPLPKIAGNVEFRNVTFSYNHSETVLENINLMANPGMIVGIVGPSGAGKTTIVNLLLGFYTPQKGSIYIDGYNIESINLQSLRKQVGVVAQGTFLFSGNVKENMRYGKIDATDEEIIKAAKAANVHSFVSRLPNGYETEIGERGVKLSGGERQRIAIARVILKNPRILILDEATSELDSESERLIQEALEPLMKNRTVFIIAHRLSTIRNADKIFVLNGGRIVEEGRHEELYDSGGVYRKLYDEQYGK